MNMTLLEEYLFETEDAPSIIKRILVLNGEFNKMRAVQMWTNHYKDSGSLYSVSYHKTKISDIRYAKIKYCGYTFRMYCIDTCQSTILRPLDNEIFTLLKTYDMTFELIVSNVMEQLMTMNQQRMIV